LIDDPDVEVLNREHVVANLNEDGLIDIEFQVETGRGYVRGDIMEVNSDIIGVIPIDAIFSPIERVNFRVENTRVGQRTDFDRLIIEIWTDGSIKPEDALAQAAKILKDHMTIFINFEEDFEAEQEEIDEDAERLKGFLSKSIEELEFSVRTYHCVKSMEILTLKELVRKNEDEIQKARHYSEKSLEEIKNKLVELNLSLGMKE
jgi:DNA-directed RNA polymerase subunit alpha